MQIIQRFKKQRCQNNLCFEAVKCCQSFFGLIYINRKQLDIKTAVQKDEGNNPEELYSLTVVLSCKKKHDGVPERDVTINLVQLLDNKTRVLCRFWGAL